jgi:hypothetical protein
MEENRINPQRQRTAVTEELVSRAWRDPAFKNELLKDPRGVIQRELGVQFPETVKLYVHEETPEALHLVLPLPPAALTAAVVGSGDLADADVVGFALKEGECPRGGTASDGTSCLPNAGRRG